MFRGHALAAVSFSERAGGSRGAAQVCREFCPLASTQGAAAGAVIAYDAQQLAASSTALWQRGLRPVPKQNLESKKLPNLATVTH